MICAFRLAKGWPKELLIEKERTKITSGRPISAITSGDCNQKKITS